jgi:hypothetical protein
MTLLRDRYELGRVLGRGGMAQVFEARDRLLDRRVAVKVLDSRLAGDTEFVARFQREARSVAKLNHPNVVAVYDTGVEDGTHFLVMEYVEGRTLADHLREGPLAPERAVQVGREVLVALGAAHQRGLIHRDVKPANVMVTPEGRAKVMDFGIARPVEDNTRLTSGTSVVGTPTYMAPEQVEARPLDGRTDLYAVGAVLYECVVGSPPFDGSTALTVAAQHVRDAPVPPRRRRPGVPAGLEAVIMRALQKDPARRWPTAAAFRRALDQSLSPAGAAALTAPGPLPPTGPVRTAALGVTSSGGPARLRGAPEWLRGRGAVVAIVIGALLVAAALLASSLTSRDALPETSPVSPGPVPATAPEPGATAPAVDAPAGGGTRPSPAPSPTPSAEAPPSAPAVPVPSTPPAGEPTPTVAPSPSATEAPTPTPTAPATEEDDEGDDENSGPGGGGSSGDD